MSQYGYTNNPFSICFTSLKMKYSEYDKSIDESTVITSDNTINVFISVESVLTNLSMIRDLENKLLLERNFPIILESEFINLCAHYKRFFRGNGLKTKIFMYYTNLKSDEFINFKVNDEYRSYYINKYMQNPKFQLLGKKLVSTIIPTIKKIMEFIPDVYFIEATNFEGSLIPKIVASKSMANSKNFIITSDRYDTQYLLDDNFMVHYLKRSTSGSRIHYRFNSFIEDLFNENHEDNTGIQLFNNDSFYSILLASLGDKTRSIDPIKGIGTKTILKTLNAGIINGEILKDSKSFDIISTIFSKDYIEELSNNYDCININKQCEELSDQFIFDITSQIIDRFDYNSLLLLNSTTYKDYPLMLPELTE